MIRGGFTYTPFKKKMINLKRTKSNKRFNRFFCYRHTWIDILPHCFNINNNSNAISKLNNTNNQLNKQRWKTTELKHINVNNIASLTSHKYT